jgi:hypothetical protein
MVYCKKYTSACIVSLKQRKPILKMEILGMGVTEGPKSCDIFSLKYTESLSVHCQKDMCDAGLKHVDDGKFRHRHTGRSGGSKLMADFSDRYVRMA